MVKNKFTAKPPEGKRVAGPDYFMARILLNKKHYAYFCRPYTLHQ
jgi:hypothetical protein